MQLLKNDWRWSVSNETKQISKNKKEKPFYGYVFEVAEGWFVSVTMTHMIVLQRPLFIVFVLITWIAEKH